MTRHLIKTDHYVESNTNHFFRGLKSPLMNEERLNEHSCLNGATVTKKQVPKTNRTIRNLPVIPELELLKAISVFQTEHPKPYYYGASTTPWEYSTGNKG